MSETIKELKQQRTSSKGSIIRIKNSIDANLSHTELGCRLGIIESYYKQALYYQTQIEKLKPKDDNRSEIDELFIAAKTKILTLMGDKQSSLHEESMSFPHIQQTRLPNIKLPKFDGKYLEYKNFINTFNNLVNSEPNLTKMQKFNHLVSCLSGEALATIHAFQVTEENYEKALARLKERYDNDTLIFLENINAMFEIQKISKPLPKQLRHIVDTTSALYGSLNSLGSAEKICDAIIIHLVMSKVDPETKQKWEESMDFSALPSWANCCAMLDKRCQQLDAQCRRNIKVYSANHQQSSAPNQNQNKQHSFVTNQTNYVCTFCSKTGHYISTCQNFIVLPVDQRIDEVNKLNICFNCFSKDHNVLNCSSRYSCRFCKQRHHSLLHQQTLEITPSTSTAFSHPAIQTITTTTNVILATAVILVRDKYDNYQVGRALLDSGSQVNFITDTFCSNLGIKRFRYYSEILGIGSLMYKVNFKTQTTIKSRVNDFEMPLPFLVSKNLTGYHPDENINIDDFDLPANITLADPAFYLRHGIDLLIGAEAFYSLLSVGQIRLGENLPTVQKTVLGWVVSGKYKSNQSSNQQSSLCLFEKSNDDIGHHIELLWKLESVDSVRQTMSTEQQACEKHFKNNVLIQDDGRIIVRLPLKKDRSLLGNSRDVAMNRFLSLERRLNNNPTLRTQYNLFMKEYEELGHMSRVDDKTIPHPNFYIPHHCVLKPDSVSTKLRVVFDGSCKSSSQVSLNDIMMVGPTIQNDLLITLLRFRCHRYGLTADVVKMYRQVLVHQDDRHLQLIFWRDDNSKPVETYSLNTVTYGTASAPYLAIRSLHHALEKFPVSHEIGKAIIKNDFYVDDMLTGADDLHTLQLIKDEVTEILSKSNFTLSKWHSNNTQIATISDGIKEMTVDDNITSTLGISWHQCDDTFHFKFKPNKEFSHVTKRSILSLTSTLFDPMGLISPIIIKAKILLQQLWLSKCNWDESVPQEIYTSWENLVEDFHNLPTIKIQRFIRMTNMIELQVHGFGDASTKAYGCCLYFRCKDSFGNVVVNLLVSKSRVAPLKTKTLPRLELCAAHLLAKLWNKVKQFFKYNISKTYFWSDSQVTLHWINSHSSTLSTFVGNRVAEIQECSKDACWRYVDSNNNPADLVSRGCTVDQLNESTWIHGPAFLMLSSCDWPQNMVLNLSEEDMQLEKRKSVHTIQLDAIPYELNLIHKFGNYMKCLRVFSYVFRVQRKLPIPDVIISPDELTYTLHHIIWVIQNHYFSTSIMELQKYGSINGPLLSLKPFLAEVSGVQLVRVGGRLLNSQLPISSKFPFLLPKSDPFVKALVIHFHRTNYHAGPRALVAILQQQFWIVNCRTLARQVVNQCVQCVRYKPKLLTQIMGNLPKDRVTGVRAFEVVGVDFGGPIPTYLKIRGKTPYKSYIAVFVCFATKAVHLECVSDLSSDAFIAALKRFVGRRGVPSKIYCDNATNFVGADKKLKEFRSHFNQPSSIDAVKTYCSSKFIEFSFIPPRAPHFGGLWEAAVKTAKSHMYRTLASARLTFEELTTALVEIEAVMNSRPLTPSSTDPNDLEVITAGHFIIGCSLQTIPERVNTDAEISNLQRWQRITAVKAHFWRRWHYEYLTNLQSNYKWQRPCKNIKVDDMVLVHEDNLPPMKWVTGRIINIVTGSDGHTRVADIKTPTTTLRRPISKLALLPIN